MFKTHRSFTLSTGMKGNTIAVINNLSTIFVLYHSTVVVEKRGKTVTLRNGGWDTISTRIVINTALAEMGHLGYVHKRRGETVIMFKDGTVKPFISGMKIKAVQS